VIPHRAGVRVIAEPCEREILAASLWSADVVRAGVLVVAFHRITHAGARLAMVGHRAWIVIAAFARAEGRIGTSLFALAGVLRALVVVVTDVDVVPLGKGGFIRFVVAVVVDAVAGLGGRSQGIAWGQTLRGADSLARADTEIVVDFTGSPEAQLNGGLGAGTETGIGHALLEDDAVDGLPLLAGEPPGALPGGARPGG